MDMEQIYILFENISDTSAEKNSFLIERAVSFIKSRIIRNEDMMRDEVEYLVALYANLYLIEKETITGKEFMKIFREVKGIPDPDAPAPEEVKEETQVVSREEAVVEDVLEETATEEKE